MIAISTMKPMAMAVIHPSESSPGCIPSQVRTTLTISSPFAAKARAAVDAEVIPEHITTKHTRKVTKWMPNALWVYSAAPAACGYLVTSSRYEQAVRVATTKATRNGSKTTPPTCLATTPVTE